MTTAIRCETCRWWFDHEEDVNGGPMGSCWRFPATTERYGDVGYCGEWAHDPRRFEVEADLADGAKRLVSLDGRPPEFVLWPWEIEK